MGLPEHKMHVDEDKIRASGLRSSITRVGETDLGSSGRVEMTVKTGTDAGCIGANSVRCRDKTHRER